MTPNAEKFASLFPLKARITQEMIDHYAKYPFDDTENCPGALALKAALGENSNLLLDCKWGGTEGYNVIKDMTSLLSARLTTEEDIFLPNVKVPMDITFTIISIY